MIEFKAQCGHSVRAKDSDAGKMVKCRYCGRVVQVPLADNGKLEALLGEPDAARPTATPKPGARYRQPRAPTRLIKALLGLIYVVVAVVALAFGLKLVLQRVHLPRTSEPQTPAETPAPEPQGRPASPNPYAECSQLKLGQSGLVLRSVPTGARVYLAGPEQDKAAEANPTRNSSLYRAQTPLVLSDLQPGQYRAGFALAINDELLCRWPGYFSYRGDVEKKGRRDLDYFLPDDADGQGIDNPGNGPLLIYRTYPAVLRSTEWSVVIALFLPALPIEEYLSQLPADTRFDFREQRARDELKFYGVSQDQSELFIRASGSPKAPPPRVRTPGCNAWHAIRRSHPAAMRLAPKQRPGPGRPCCRPLGTQPPWDQGPYPKHTRYPPDGCRRIASRSCRARGHHPQGQAPRHQKPQGPHRQPTQRLHRRDRQPR
jgi:hypothetical protein